MKLTFFEKELFDAEAFEKPTIAINSIDKAQAESVKKIATELKDGAFVSSSKNNKIRQIRIPAEFLDFYTDGTSFTGKFKHTKLTSGEPEIVSRTTAPQVTKNINVSFRANVNLRAIEEDRPTTNIELSSIFYEPFIRFKLGVTNVVEIVRGFAEFGRFIEIYSGTRRTFINGYQALRNFFSGRYSTGLFSRNRILTDFQSSTPEESLPNSILNKEETTPLSTTEVQTITQEHSYQNFLAPYRETQYWRVLGNVKNNFNVKDYSLRGAARARDLVTPVRQTVTYDNPQVIWSNQDGSRRHDPLSVSLDAIFPKNLSSSNFSITVQSGFATGDSTGMGGRNVIQAFAYTSIIRYQLVGFSQLFNLLIPGITFARWFNQFTGEYGGGSFFFDAGDVELTAQQPTGIYQKDSFYDFDNRSGSRQIRHIQAATMPRITKAQLDAMALSTGSQRLGQRIHQINTALAGMRTGGRPSISPYIARPIKETDFTSPVDKVSTNDLGMATTTVDINGVRQVGKSVGVTATNWNNTSTEITNEAGVQTGRFRNFYYILVSLINFRTLPLLSGINVNDDTGPGTTELKGNLPITLVSNTENNYQIVNIDFVTNELYISKNFGREFVARNELTSIGVEDTSGRVTEVSITLNRRQSTFNAMPVTIFTSRDIVDFFRPKFQQTIAPDLSMFNGVNVPLFTAWLKGITSSIDSVRALLSSQVERIRLFIAAGTQGATSTSDARSQLSEDTQNLLQGVDKSFPHISLHNILYNDAEDRIYMVLNRGVNSPVPDKRYFSSVSINNRSFSFGSSRYRSFLNASTSPYGIRCAEYSWTSSANLLQGLRNVPIVFRKSGTSYTNPIDLSRLVRKSTVNTEDEKNWTEIISGLYIADIGFTSTSFYVEFNGSVAVDNFQTIALKDNDNTEYITRQLLTSDAVRTESQGKTKFVWNDMPEFAILAYNKEYTIEILKGANETEKRLFIPVQAKDNFHFIKNYKQGLTSISFDLQRTSFKDISKRDFVAMALLNASDNRVISGDWFNSSDFTLDNANEFNLFNNSIPAAPASGTKVILAFQVELRDSTEITLLKLTDIYADTFVCLDTNIGDLNVLDNDNNPLIHPSDLDTIKEVNEGGLRHVFIKLKQPITQPQIRIAIRKIVDGTDKVRINRMLVLKNIGSFTQFPRIRVDTSTAKEQTISAINTAHITSKPLTFNYNFDFPPLTKVQDLMLAQDLFSRAAEYNEFVIWVSGGDIAPKITNLLGYRFIDFVKSLTINDFSIRYIDDRPTSGVNFSLVTKQVSRLHI